MKMKKTNKAERAAVSNLVADARFTLELAKTVRFHGNEVRDAQVVLDECEKNLAARG